jgi:hypothetical protein
VLGHILGDFSTNSSGHPGGHQLSSIKKTKFVRRAVKVDTKDKCLFVTLSRLRRERERLKRDNGEKRKNKARRSEGGRWIACCCCCRRWRQNLKKEKRNQLIFLPDWFVSKRRLKNRGTKTETLTPFHSHCGCAPWEASSAYIGAGRWFVIKSLSF